MVCSRISFSEGNVEVFGNLQFPTQMGRAWFAFLGILGVSFLTINHNHGLLYWEPEYKPLCQRGSRLQYLIKSVYRRGKFSENWFVVWLNVERTRVMFVRTNNKSRAADRNLEVHKRWQSCEQWHNNLSLYTLKCYKKIALSSLSFPACLNNNHTSF